MRTHWIALALLVGCGDDGGGSTTAGDSGTDAVDCTRRPAAADRTRYVVVSHPYAEGGEMRSNDWEVLELSTAGALSRPNRHFTMGRAIVGTVAFTLDGRIGIAAQDDGSLGIFKLDDTGNVTVLHETFMGAFYASSVVVAPDGSILVLDNNWRTNGGGIYRIDIDCNDVVTDAGLVAASQLPGGLVFRGDDSALLAATDIGMSPAGSEGHVLAWNAGQPTVSASADMFAGEMMAIVGGSAVSASGGHFFVGDTSGFSSEPNSVAIAPINGTAFGTVERVEVEDPFAIVADPDRDQALVASGFGDALFVLGKPDATWELTELTYMGAGPQLPSGVTSITAGALRGHVLVAELSGVRQARFTTTGVEDLGLFLIGTEIEDSVGAIGVTP